MSPALLGKCVISKQKRTSLYSDYQCFISNLVKDTSHMFLSYKFNTHLIHVQYLNWILTGLCNVLSKLHVAIHLQFIYVYPKLQSDSQC